MATKKFRMSSAARNLQLSVPMTTKMVVQKVVKATQYIIEMAQRFYFAVTQNAKLLKNAAKVDKCNMYV